MEEREYYSLPGVRERIREYCGGKRMTSVFIAGSHESLRPRSPEAVAFFPPQTMDQVLSQGWDILRSLWDKELLLFLMDIDYVNFDFRGEVYINPEEALGKALPILEKMQDILRMRGIEALTVMTGRGFHIIWGISIRSRLFGELERIGIMPPTVEGKYKAYRGKGGELLPLSYAKSFHALSFLGEYLAYLLLQEGRYPIPVVIDETIVGRNKKGREAICLDLSAFGDPLYLRYFRCAFSTYRKHKIYPEIYGREASALPPFACLPFVLPFEDMLRVRKDLREAGELAQSTTVSIPRSQEGTRSLLEDYLASSLRKAHLHFYEEEEEPPERWGDSYDRLPSDKYPACVSLPLRNPNPLLLEPAVVQHITRFLMSEGWHPRHIAGLIRSKYERNFHWGYYWFKYDACLRAEQRVRIFASLIETRLDQGLDFNCVSHKEKGLCFAERCPFNLVDYREQLLEREDLL